MYGACSTNDCSAVLTNSGIADTAKRLGILSSHLFCTRRGAKRPLGAKAGLSEAPRRFSLAY